MKKIIIFYASYGGGHLSAAKSIESYLKNNFNNLEVELIDCMKYINKTIERVSTTAYREIAKKAPWAWGKIYFDSQKGPLAHISTKANRVMAIKLLRLLRKEKPDLIISTHPFGSQMCSYLKRKQKISAEIATIMTDFKSHDQWLVGSDFVDYFFVSNDNMKKELIEKNIYSSKIFVTGIPISSRFFLDFDKKQILDELGFTPDKKTILFFGGGEFGLGKTKTLEVLESLLQNFTNLQIIAISGKNESMKAHFDELVHKYYPNNSVVTLEYTDKVPEFMAVSDLVITKPGGLTTTEAITSCVPMLLINPIPGQEEENADFLVNSKVAVWIKKHDDPTPVLTKILIDEDKLSDMKKNTFYLAKPNSAKSICEILLNSEYNFK